MGNSFASLHHPRVASDKAYPLLKSAYVGDSRLGDGVKTLHLNILGLAAFVASFGSFMLGVGTPTDAGACSCVASPHQLVSEDVMPLSPDGLSETEIQTMVARETGAWPEYAR